MARPFRPARRGERTVVAEEGIRTTTTRRLLRRLRLLRWLGGGFYALAATVTLGVVLLIAGIVVVVGHGSWLSVQTFGFGFLTSSDWDAVHNSYGALPAIVGTLLTSALALVIAVPISLGVAVFLSEVAPSWLRRPLTYVIDLSAAVPSVVYGFWAYIVLYPLMRDVVEPTLASWTGGAFPFSSETTGLGILTATLVLAVMIIPTIAAVARESLRAVPRVHRESALSLGATRWEATRIGVLSPARGGIAAGVILGLGRALGETIAVTMVIGNLPILPGTLFSQGETLASTIVNTFPGEPGLNRSAIMELALLLLIITIAVNVLARAILWRIEARAEAGEAGHRRWFGRRRRTYPSDRSLAGRTGLSLTPQEESDWRRRAREAAPRRILRRRRVEWVVVGLAATAVVLALLPFAGVLFTAVQYGGEVVVHPSFYTSLPPQEGCNPGQGVACSYGGIGPEIQGTLIMLGLGALIAVPVGLLGGIFLAEYGRNRVARVISFLTDVMTGVPTIIIGLFVFTLFVYFDRAHPLSALAGGVALGVLMIPIAVRGTEEALRAVPNGLRESALAIGFPRHRVTLRVVLGSARGGLVTGMLLAASRAAGDTASLLFTYGGSNFWFQNLNAPTAALTPFIFDNFGSSFANLQADAWGAALVLLAMMLVIGIGTRLVVPEAAAAAEAG